MAKLKGVEVAEARERLGGISQEELGELVGKSQSTVSRWEKNGDEKIPWSFSQRIRALLRRAQSGQPLREPSSVPGHAVRLVYPEGVTGPAIWVELPERRQKKQPPEAGGAPSAPVEAGQSQSAGDGATEDSLGLSLGRALQWMAGFAVAAAVLAGCFVHLDRPGASVASPEARRCELTDGKGGPATEKLVLTPLSERVYDKTMTGRADPSPESVSMPSQPYDWQKLAPCGRGEVEKLGGCWFEGKGNPPCSSVAVESEGKCLAPIPREPERKKKPVASTR